MPSPTWSSACLRTLDLLRERHNVLVSGPPAAGKSLLLNEVAAAFLGAPPEFKPTAKPFFDPTAVVSIPAKTPPPKSDADLQSILPSPERTDRKVFRTVFHQTSKYRDFLTGIAPVLGTDKAGTFHVVEGTLFRASEHALSATGASLLIIDEINRGPAVQVFGGAIVAFESEKRLAPDGKAKQDTQYFELLSPKTNKLVEYAFPHHLYILAAMNQADVSVEPLDVAFLRRWTPLALEADPALLRTYFGLPPQPLSPPEVPATTVDVYEAAVNAWDRINSRIALGRGPEFRIGHGVLMVPNGPPPTTIDAALRHLAQSWQTIRAHVAEVFFGDIRGVAAVLNAAAGISGHPYRLEETFFADEPREQLVGPAEITAENIYKLLTAITS